MKKNIESLVEAWFNDSKEYAINNFALCSEWLTNYVENCDQEFLNDFFTGEEIEENDVETLRSKALAWIDSNADEIVNFDDFR